MAQGAADCPQRSETSPNKASPPLPVVWLAAVSHLPKNSWHLVKEHAVRELLVQLLVERWNSGAVRSVRSTFFYEGTASLWSVTQPDVVMRLRCFVYLAGIFEQTCLQVNFLLSGTFFIQVTIYQAGGVKKVSISRRKSIPIDFVCKLICYQEEKKETCLQVNPLSGGIWNFVLLLFLIFSCCSSSLFFFSVHTETELTRQVTPSTKNGHAPQS